MPIVKLVDRSGSLRFQFSNGLAGAVPGSRPIIGTVPAAGSQLEGTSPPPFLDPRKPPTTSAHFERRGLLLSGHRLWSYWIRGPFWHVGFPIFGEPRWRRKSQEATGRHEPRGAAPPTPHWQGGRTWTSKEPGSKRLPSRTGLPRPLHTQQVSETIEGGSPTPYHTKGRPAPARRFAGPP